MVALVSCLAGASACGPGPDGEREIAIDATTYVAAIDPFLPPNTDPDARPVVYIVPVGDAALPLGTQVAVIDAFAELHDVRFVDSDDAAVEADTEGQPPRDDGMLLGVGTVSESAPHVLRVEIYAGHDEVEARRVTVAVRGDRWVVVEIEPVEPEVLVGE